MTHLFRKLVRCALCFLACVGYQPNSVAELTFYVSPSGKDRWSGLVADPTPDRKDGPFASVSAALRAARSARKNAAVRSEAVTILLRAGTYELAEPIRLSAADSGFSAQEPFTIAGYPNEHPILSGGRRITGWARVKGGPELWQTVVPEARQGREHIRTLFVNGRRATRARTPNAGSFFQMQGERLDDNPARFRFKPGDIKPRWATEPDAEVVGFEKWTVFRQPIREVLVWSDVVKLSGQAARQTREAGARYFVENTKDSLDAPGEWQLDRRTGLLRYRPLPGETLSKVQAIAPRLGPLIRLEGDPASRRPLRHVILRGLTFSHSDWTLPERGYTDTQAAFEIRGDLQAAFAVDCAIEQCSFSHLGGYAIDLGKGCQRFRLIANDVFDIGAGGVRIGEPNDGQDLFAANHSHQITDNHLHSLGRVYASGVGVLIMQSGTNRVAYNRIHDLYYTAVSVGWTWAYRESPCRENIVEFNHLHDIGQGLLSDLGAVYTLGIQRGTVIRRNLIHDVNSFGYGGCGLYADEGSTGILWENNVVYRTKSAGFNQHYGRENIVRNNVFAFGKEHQVMRGREDPHVSFIFTNNIVYFDSGTLLGSTWINDRFIMERNVYFDARTGPARGAIKFSGITLDQWRARGHDTNSVFADPQFVAPGQFNFALKPTSPALKLGFRPIGRESVGPRPQARTGFP